MSCDMPQFETRGRIHLTWRPTFNSSPPIKEGWDMWSVNWVALTSTLAVLPFCFGRWEFHNVGQMAEHSDQSQLNPGPDTPESGYMERVCPG